MKMKVLTLGVAAITTLGVSACANTTANTTANAEANTALGASISKNGYKNQKITIVWWTQTANPQAVIKAFNKVYPNITVKAPLIGGNRYTKLETALKAGSGAPDVVQIEYQYLPQFISLGGLADISQYDAKYKSDFPSWVWNQVDVGGKLYGIPEDIGPGIYLYRPDVFRENGITVPKTWAQFTSDAIEYHKKNPGKYFAFFAYTDGGFLNELLWQAGARPFVENSNGSWAIDFNSPTAQKVMNFWGKLIKDGAVLPVDDTSPQFDSDIGKGLFASMVSAAWAPQAFLQPYVKKGTNDWNVANIPQWSSSKFVDGNWGGSANCVTVQSKNKAAAALFAAWINTSEQGVSVAATSSAVGGRGLFPAAKFASKVPAFNAPNPTLANQVDAPVLEYAAAHVDPNFEFSPWTDYVYNEMAVEFTKAVNNKESWAQALNNIQQAVVQFAKASGYQVNSK
ncbi:MAG: extracellular solute-binding protein [Alicyclobacillus sp.]|nr:extracellular solute-binding protein [Alicyclobacillus sp.]